MIAPEEARKAKKIFDAEGRLTEVLHYKCSQARARRHRAVQAPEPFEMQRTTKESRSPEAQQQREVSEREYAVLRARQAQIAEDREMEPADEREDDWRDPVVMDLDDISPMSHPAGESTESSEEQR